MSGAKTVVNAASATKAEFKRMTDQLQSKAPEPNEAIKWLRSTANSYAAFIPGGRGYVDALFKDLETVQQKHGKEVEKIVNDAYAELKEASQGGLNMQSVASAWGVIEKAASQLKDLAGDSASDILDNHPGVKEKFGGQVEQLKGMADKLGPEAKKEMDDVWNAVSDAVKGGFSASSVTKVKQLIEDKTKKIQQLGDKAWDKGLEQMKPYLDKNPQVKQVIEENAESLKQGNVSEIYEQVKNAVSSGNVDDLKKYVKDAGEKAKNSSFGDSFQKYAKMIPGGSEIFPKLQKLQEVANKRGDEAEKIVKGAYKDIQDVLQKRTEEAEKLAEKAKKD
jgi:cell division septum initiation protein DivIVA